MDCIFCKIVNKELESNIVYEDDKVIAFHDVNPQAPIHILFIPKEHIESANSINETNAHLIGHIHTAINKVAKDLGIDRDGYRIVNNCGINGGQTVYHIHFHLLAGRQLSWPPG